MKENSCVGLTKENLSPNFNTTETEPGYDIRIYSGGCYFFNKTTSVWEGVGVTVEEGGSNVQTSCSTNHLTSFGTGFFPTPNTINFEFVLSDFDFNDDLTIVMVILVSLILFLVTLIWAQIKDRRDIKLLEPHWMKDNQVTDVYMYEIVVQTGPLLSHGTESKVQLILTGEEDETQIRTLSDPTKNFFKKDSLDTFLMTVPRPLGHLHYIQIWHDNSGIREMQPWYLSYLTVHDLQTGEKFRFLADKWLAIDRGEFSSDIQVQVSIHDGEANKSWLVRQGLFNKLRDDHVFWSVFSRPIRSRFTRTQRTCVSLSCLYLAMLANAMWYERQEDYEAESYFSMQGMLNFSRQEIMQGVWSSLVVLIPTIVLIVIFRKARPFTKRRSRFDNVVNKAAEEGRVVLPELPYKRTQQSNCSTTEASWSWNPIFYLIGWLLTFLFVVGGLGMVGLYGLSFGNNKCYHWLTAMVVNLFWNLFVESIVKVALLAVVIAVIFRRPAWDQDHVDIDEELPQIYFDPDSKKGSPDNKPKAKVPEFDPVYLEPLRNRRIQEAEMNQVIIDILTYIIYVLIVLIVSMGNRDSNAFYMKENLKTTVVHGGLLCGRPEGEGGEPCEDGDLPEWFNPQSGEMEPNPFVDFQQVREVNQWWLWVNSTLIPNVRVQNWYNGDPPYGLRGYLDDRVHRLIGYAVIRQVREKVANCRSPPMMRDYVDSCTGDLKMGTYDEDYRVYCMGWQPLISENCTRLKEYQFVSEAERHAQPTYADYNSYSGGGYVLKLKGHIDKLKEKISTLQQNRWVDNRTRALITEFSVYNPQVNLFGIVKIVGEIVGGGVNPFARIEVVRLTKGNDLWSQIVTLCEILFAVSAFYYIMNSITLLKKVGCSEFFNDSWNIVDIITIFFSIAVVALYVARLFIVMDMLKVIRKTRGNEFVPIDYAQLVNMYYDYAVAFTVFTSLLKFCRLLSFAKAFRQVAATIKFCLMGLANMILEIFIVFGSFCAFFYFILSPFLKDFYTPFATLRNTVAMAIGKFNFANLRAANELAAWIFFAFSIVVNMILINMMIAIINMAFEDTKANTEAYGNKFDILDYMKRSTRELTGVNPAERELPEYVTEDEDMIDKDDIGEEDDTENKPISVELSDKTNQLLDYIEKTYLKGMIGADGQAKNIVDKIKLADNSPKAKAMEFGFDSIFAEGPTPTRSAILDRTDPHDTEGDLEALAELEMELNCDDGLSISNVDGMNL